MNPAILVVSSCTASKIQTTGQKALAAERLYTGQQHVRLMHGVNQYRKAREPAGSLRFRILSALHGLLSPNRAVHTYDHSFSGLAAASIRQEAHEKNIPRDVRALLRRSFEIGVLLLADPYLRACDLTPQIKLGGPVIAFCSPAAAARMPNIPGLRAIPLSNSEARRFSCGMVALKGELGRRLLVNLSAAPSELATLAQSTTDVLSWLDTPQASSKVALTAAA